jgi:hypothetical protein
LVAAVLAVATTQVVAAQPAAASSLPSNTFTGLHVVAPSSYGATLLHCPSNEVMIGIHFNNKRAICAKLRNGYRVYHTYFDVKPGTQVPEWAPKMHGCASFYIIQGIDLSNETLKCVALADSAGRPVSELPKWHYDFSTQSTIYRINNPTMHVCGHQLAMQGVHKKNNHLWCVG